MENPSYAHDLIHATMRELEWTEPTEEEMPLVAMYALLAAVTGSQTTTEQVHDAWSIWTVAFRDCPGHPSLVPFEFLRDEVKALDEPYVKAIRRVSG